MTTRVGINGFGRLGRPVEHTADSLIVGVGASQIPIAVLSERDRPRSTGASSAPTS